MERKKKAVDLQQQSAGRNEPERTPREAKGTEAMQPMTTTPNARADFIDALLAGHFDATTADRTLSPWQARYALWLGFEVIAEWSPYEGRTVTRSVSTIEAPTASHITFTTNGDNAHPLTIKRDALQLWADRNQQEQAQRARTIPAPGQRNKPDRPSERVT